jgi:hypothetical protein
VETQQVVTQTPTPAPEPTVETTEKTETTVEAVTTEPTPETTEDKGSEPSRAEKRIKQLVAEREYYRGLAEGRQAQVQAPPVVETVPAPENFDNYDDYLVAKAKHEIKKEYVQEIAKARAFEAQRTFIQKIENDPDAMEIFNDQTLPVSDVMAAAIRESDVAPKLLKFLSENRQEAARIYRLSPYAASKEIGRIEANIVATPPPVIRKVSQAPEPIKTVGDAEGVVTADPDKMPINDFMAKRNKESPPGRRR